MRPDNGRRETHHRGIGGTVAQGADPGKQSENRGTGHLPHDADLPARRNGKGMHGKEYQEGKRTLHPRQGDETGERQPEHDPEPEQRKLRVGIGRRPGRRR